MLRPSVYKTNRNFWSDPFNAMEDMFPGFWNGTDLENSFSGFSTDVIEKDGNYILEAELPGFSKEELHIDLKNDILTISASHKEENEEKDNSKYLRRERRYSSYSRSFKVENVLPEDISASYKNGILEITIPKRSALPESAVKQIEIH